MSVAGKRTFDYFRRGLERWPKDALRPDCQLQDVLAKRLDASNLVPFAQASLGPAEKQAAEFKQVNALYTLLENRYQTKYKLSDKMMKPKFNPTYYEDVMREVDEAPTRTWAHMIKNKLSGMFRLK